MLLAVKDIGNTKRILEYHIKSMDISDLQKPTYSNNTVDIKVKDCEVVIKAVVGSENVVVLQFKKLGFKNLPVEFKRDFTGIDGISSCSRVLTLVERWLFYIGKNGKIVRVDVEEESPTVLQIEVTHLSGTVIQLAATQDHLYALTVQGAIYKLSQESFKVISKISLRPESSQWITIGAEGNSIMVYGYCQKGRSKSSILKLLSQDLETLDELEYEGDARQLYPYNENLWIAVSNYKSLQLLDTSRSKIRLAGKPLFLQCTRTIGVVRSGKRQVIAYGLDLLCSIDISFN